MVVRLIALMSSLVLFGCSTDPVLRVDIVTDFIAGEEFDEVFAIIEGEARVLSGTPNEDWLGGLRAFAEEVPRGTLEGSVGLRLRGEDVLTRPIQIRVDTDTLSTFYLLRSCLGVLCPAAGDSPSALACLGGECVPPECSEDGDTCAPLQCEGPADCESSVGCLSVSCDQGLCLFSNGCSAASACNVELDECVPLSGSESDGGVNDGGDASIDGSTDGSMPEGWADQILIKANFPDEGDEFGYDVAMNDAGDLLAIGAPQESGLSGEDDNESSGRGAVFIYRRDGDTNTWRFMNYLKPSVVAREHFGRHVALSGDGNVLLVSAPRASSSGGGVQGGAVYIFESDGESWIDRGRYQPGNNDPNDQFGNSIAANGDGSVIVIGAAMESSSVPGVHSASTPMGDDNSSPFSGAVHVYRRLGDMWEEEAFLKSLAPDDFDSFGASVDINEAGTLIAVGVPSESSANPEDVTDNSSVSSGAVFLYAFDGASWNVREYLKSEEIGDRLRFGSDLSFNAAGTRLAVGAVGSGSTYEGVAHIFEELDGRWAAGPQIRPSIGEDSDRFTSALELSSDGQVLFVAAFDDDSEVAGEFDNRLQNSGIVYAFVRTATGEWLETDWLKQNAPRVGAQFGTSIATSNAANWVVVGTRLDSTSGAGVAPELLVGERLHSGAANVFRRE